MPDVWTFNQQKLKTALEAQGAICEQEPRVLKDRDPFWTCHIDLKEVDVNGIIGYDIYIQDANSFLKSPTYLSLLVIVLFFGFIAGFLWRPRFSASNKSA
jgi:hypothetical protein